MFRNLFMLRLVVCSVLLSPAGIRYLSYGGIGMSAFPHLLQCTISGKCNFAIARELLLKCKIRLHENITRIEIVLAKMTSFNTCTLGSLLVLSKLWKGKLQVSVKNRSPDVYFLFDPEFLARPLASSSSHHVAGSRGLHDNCSTKRLEVHYD